MTGGEISRQDTSEAVWRDFVTLAFSGLPAATLTVFVTVFIMNLLIAQIGAPNFGALNAGTAALQFLAASLPCAWWVARAKWRQLETLLLIGAAAYLPAVLGTAAVGFAMDHTGADGQEHVETLFLRVVKNAPAIFTSITVFWWLGVQKLSNKTDETCVEQDLHFDTHKDIEQGVGLIVRETALKQNWLWTIMSANASIGVALILMAAGTSAAIVYAFLVIVTGTTVLALVLREGLKRLALDDPRLDLGLATFDVLSAGAWGALAWFLVFSQATAEIAFVLPCLAIGGLMIGALAAPRNTSPVIGPAALFTPYLLALLIAQPKDWLLNLIAAIAVFVMAALFSLLLSRPVIQSIRLRLSLEHANAQLADETALRRREYNVRERLLRSVSHDLRQPISALNLFLDRIQSTQDTDRRAEALSEAVQCVNSANAVIDSISQVAWTAGEVQVAAPAPTRLRAIFDTLYTEFHEEAERKNLKLRTRDANLSVMADKQLLIRILRNLMSNSIRVTATGGVLVAARTRGSSVELLVIDTGPGVPAGQLGTIFEEFKQSGETPSGTMGIGLFIVRELTCKLQGEIIAVSKPGRGSTFGIRLPRVLYEVTSSELVADRKPMLAAPID
ncbi:MAG: HAMP domain-containing sensor histidine kinase [Pseudomonadota bacterium]